MHMGGCHVAGHRLTPVSGARALFTCESSAVKAGCKHYACLAHVSLTASPPPYVPPPRSPLHRLTLTHEQVAKGEIVIAEERGRVMALQDEAEVVG